MNSVELKKLLTDVPSPISAIENKVGIPKNVLQQSLKGKRTLPKEWAIKLVDFIEKKQYIGLRRKKPELKFGKTIAKGKEPILKAKVEYKETDVSAYDGKKTDKFINDEYGQVGKVEKKPFMSDAIKKKLGL